METRKLIIAKFLNITTEEEATKIEKSIFNFVNQYCINKAISQNFKNNIYINLYIAKARQLFHNLKKDSYINNKQIHILLQKNKLNLDEIAFYSYKELYPSNWKKFNKDLEILNKDISDFDKDVQATDQFTCNKCKKNKCVYSQFQIRSADEPITSFITCLHCGNNWRE
jgi:transcription elongation factor S-II